MNRMAFPVGLLCSAMVAAISLVARGLEPTAVDGKGDGKEASAIDPTDVPRAAAGRPQSDLETDKQHLLAIFKAIMAYKKAKGQVPDYLSDLVPQYLPDKAVLLQPFMNAVERTGVPHALFVNKIDQARGRIRELLEALQPVSSVPLVARQIPIWKDEKVSGLGRLSQTKTALYQNLVHSKQDESFLVAIEA